MSANHWVVSYKLSFRSDREEVLLFDSNGSYVASLRFYDRKPLPNNSFYTVGAIERIYANFHTSRFTQFYEMLRAEKPLRISMTDALLAYLYTPSQEDIGEYMESPDL